VVALREDPSGLAHGGVPEIMNHLTDTITALSSQPIIMGHSFGGLFAQLPVGNRLGSAGVSIDGAGAKGVKATPPRELRSSTVGGIYFNEADLQRFAYLSFTIGMTFQISDTKIGVAPMPPVADRAFRIQADLTHGTAPR